MGNLPRGDLLQKSGFPCRSFARTDQFSCGNTQNVSQLNQNAHVREALSALIFGNGLPRQIQSLCQFKLGHVSPLAKLRDLKPEFINVEHMRTLPCVFCFYDN